MHQLTLLFLYALLVDGVAAVVDEVVSAMTGTPTGISGWVSLLVLGLAFFLFTASVFTPRVSKRMVVPCVLFLAFCTVWGVLYGGGEALPLYVAETFLALGFIVGYRHPSGSGLQDFADTRPTFTWGNFIFSLPLYALVLGGTLTLSTLGAAQKLRCKLEDSVGQYLTLQRDGIALEERRFRQGDREIRLVGMIHVAKSGFYDEITQALPEKSDAVVLLEGLTDHQSLLSGRLDYAQIAGMVGIASQRESSFTRTAAEGMKQTGAADAQGEEAPTVEYRSGDIDAAEFTPATVQWIRALQGVLQSATMREALESFLQNKETLAADTDTVYKDILDRRNEHLLGEIKKMLQDHRTVIVPWGAKHMPGLQKEIESWGFVETGRARREALHFQNKVLTRVISLMDMLPGGLQDTP
ncbi:MAG: hypothetical protein ACFUZC_01285 [Chthoniobacteraceae bacterium]